MNGGSVKRENSAYDEDAIEVGTCNSGETIDSCTAASNKYARTDWCKAGQNMKITISCDGHTTSTEAQSCAGIFWAKKQTVIVVIKLEFISCM